MAVVSVTHLSSGQKANKQGGKRSYTEVYQVTLDSVTNAAKTARDADGVPNMHSVHPYDAAAYVTAIDPTETANRLIWNVVVTYETSARQPSTSSPLNDDPIITWSVRRQTQIVVRDKNGDPILNSAYDPFDPPLEQEIAKLSVTITRNEESYNPTTALAYLYSVNNASVTIAGLTCSARTALLTDYSGRLSERDSVEYWETTYAIDFDGDTFDRYVLDQGLYYLDGSSKKRRILIEGEPADEPQRLDGSGGILAAGASNVFRQFRVRKETNWSSLSLPESA